MTKQAQVNDIVKRAAELPKLGQNQVSGKFINSSHHKSKLNDAVRKLERVHFVFIL